MTYWLNGEWRDDPHALRIDDRGFLLGDGVFETILVRGGVPAFLDAHLVRLKEALRLVSISAEPPADIAAIIRELAERNSAQKGDASLRLTITRGSGPRGVTPPEEITPTVLMTLAPAKPQNTDPRKLMISQYRRPESSVSARCKALGYLDNVLAAREAAMAGADDALMLNGAGRLACASAANIFLIASDGNIATPPVAEGALPGIVRGVLLREGAKAGLTFEERPLAPESLHDCELVLTNSLAGVVRARLTDSAETPPSAILTRLQSCYEAALGDDLQRRASAQ